MPVRAPAGLAIGAGLAVLALAWIGPLPEQARASYAAHMAMHMTVVAIGAPLVAVGIAGLVDWSPARLPAVAAVATLVDFVVVWAWHAPALHDASRSSGWVMAAEQGSFAIAALLVWVPAMVGPPLAGALALFMTAMHMTLLGVLIGLAPRAIHDGHEGHSVGGMTALQDQELGGVIMIAVSGAVYGSAALWRAAGALRPSRGTSA